MKNKQISEIFSIPTSTVAEWSNPNHNKHKIYLYLLNSSKEVAENALNKRHRLLHILNRNTFSEKYTMKEIKEAFALRDTTNITRRQATIFSKFFKECDVEDLGDLISIHGVSINKVKNIYTSIPEKQLPGVCETWNNRFKIKTQKTRDLKRAPTQLPRLLTKVLQERAHESL